MMVPVTVAVRVGRGGGGLWRCKAVVAALAQEAVVAVMVMMIAMIMTAITSPGVMDHNSTFYGHPKYIDFKLLARVNFY